METSFNHHRLLRVLLKKEEMVLKGMTQASVSLCNHFLILFFLFHSIPRPTLLTSSAFPFCSHPNRITLHLLAFSGHASLPRVCFIPWRFSD